MDDGYYYFLFSLVADEIAAWPGVDNDAHLQRCKNASTLIGATKVEAEKSRISWPAAAPAEFPRLHSGERASSCRRHLGCPPRGGGDTCALSGQGALVAPAKLASLRPSEKLRREAPAVRVRKLNVIREKRARPRICGRRAQFVSVAHAQEFPRRNLQL